MSKGASSSAQPDSTIAAKQDALRAMQPIRDATTSGYFVTPYRPRFTDDAQYIRLCYRTMALQCMSYAKDRRLAILDAPHTSRDGQPVYRMVGTVCDVRFRDGILDRICVNGLCALNSDDEDDDAIPVATHIWLYTSGLDVQPDIIYEYAGLGSDLCTISLGDQLIFECTLNAYGDEHKRMGVDQWAPLWSALIYADLKRMPHRVPRHLSGGMELIHVHDDGSVGYADEGNWARTLFEALRRHNITPDTSRLYSYEQASRIIGQPRGAFIKQRH